MEATTNALIIESGKGSLDIWKEIIDDLVPSNQVRHASKMAEANLKISNQRFDLIIIITKSFEQSKIIAFINRLRKNEIFAPILLSSEENKCPIRLDDYYNVFDLPRQASIGQLKETLITLFSIKPEQTFGKGKLAQKNSILIVEDNEQTRNLYEQFFRSWHFEVDCAGSGISAMSKIDKNKYDMVWIDFYLGDINADQIVTHVRSKYTMIQLPVIVVSGQRDISLVRKMVELGINDYLVKPVDMSAARKKIAKILKARKASLEYVNIISGLKGYVVKTTNVDKLLGFYGSFLDRDAKKIFVSENFVKITLRDNSILLIKRVFSEQEALAKSTLIFQSSGIENACKKYKVKPSQNSDSAFWGKKYIEFADPENNKIIILDNQR